MCDALDMRCGARGIYIVCVAVRRHIECDQREHISNGQSPYIEFASGEYIDKIHIYPRTKGWEGTLPPSFLHFAQNIPTEFWDVANRHLRYFVG